MDLAERVSKLEASLARSRMQLGIAVFILAPLTLAALVFEALLFVGWPRRLPMKVDRLEAREIEVFNVKLEKSGRVGLYGNEYGGSVVVRGTSTPNLTLTAADWFAECAIQGFGHNVVKLYATDERGALDLPADLGSR